MIEPMKKTTIVCLAEDQQQSIRSLQKLAAVHVIPAAPPASGKLEELKRRQAAMEAVKFRLAAIKLPPEFVPNCAPETDGESCLTNAITAMETIRSADDRITQLQRSIAQLEPWGQFDDAVILRLKERGWHTALCCRRGGAAFEAPEGALVFEVNRCNHNIYFVVLSEKELPAADLPVVSFPHGHDLQALRDECDALTAKRNDAEMQLQSHVANDVKLLEAEADRLISEIAFESARDGMGTAGSRLTYLMGYVPISRLDELRLMARKNGWAIRYEDVSPDDGAVPTKLVMPKPFRMAQVILDFIGIVPGYNEVDVSASLLVFLSFFCGMLIGDAGYGVLFTALSGWAFWKAKKTGNTQLLESFRLLLTMSLCVLGWGALTGSWFGLKWGGVPWLKNDDNIKLFCFFLGAGHLMLAHIWKAKLVHTWRDRLANIGWAMFLGANFFTVKALLIDNGDFGNFLIPKLLYIIGGSLIVLFGINWKNVGDVIYSPFAFINSFGDVLSYIRLFAVGLSSFAIADAFNSMGAGMWQGNKFLLPVGLLVILIGHTLNIALALMGVLVHGIRLNTLEFSGHIGVEWGGKPYRPLK